MKVQLATIVFLIASTSTAVAESYEAADDEDPLDDDDLYYAETETGIGFTLGGGVSGFTNDTLRDTTSAGGDWGARLTFGLRSPLAFEIAYIGSAQSIEALGLDADALLVGNGAQGALRINFNDGTLPVSPFIFGGIAWRHYDVVNTDFNTSTIADEDEVFEFPMGAGFSIQADGLVVDIRGEFRYVQEGDLVPTFENADGTVDFDDPGAMHRWGVTMMLGVEI